MQNKDKINIEFTKNFKCRFAFDYYPEDSTIKFYCYHPNRKTHRCLWDKCNLNKKLQM